MFECIVESRVVQSIVCLFFTLSTIIIQINK